MKYYSLKNILEYKAQYNMIFGERSNGKTYAVLKYALERGKKLAYVRRYREDFRGKRGQALYQALVENGEIEKATGGEWSNVYYYGGKWYFCNYADNGERVVNPEPFAYAFALTETEHDKGSSFPDIEIVMFDEFLSRGAYLTDEFVLFMNTLSTIIRQRDNVKIFMCGNTVNKFCPYFSEMGLKHIKEMKQGDIDVYTYGNTELRVAVEYADSPNRGKKSDVYFAFDSPELKMITSGAWEIAVYPHCPVKYKPKDVCFTYFIEFDRELLQAEIVKSGANYFTFIHRKTTPLKDPAKDLIFSPEPSALPNHRRRITRPFLNVEKMIWSFYATEKVFYQNNEVGEIVRNYLLWCKKE